jgi:DNA-binding beta-propeller fold protein YncE
MLRDHRKKQIELRLVLGQGAQPVLVFSTVEGGLLSPDNLGRDWGRVCWSPKRTMGHPNKRRAFAFSVALLTICLALGVAFSAVAVEQGSLTLESKIPLGNVRGRIDHLTIDRASQRLFVAELGNNSLGVVDLKRRKVLHRIARLNEPQGVAYVSAVGSIYVANGGDGSVRIFNGNNFSPLARVDLRADADNLRVDEVNNLVFAGFGSGGIAIIDARSRVKVGEISLKGHPEGFELEPSGKRIFVNVPNAREIAVLDRASNAQIASWKIPEATGNFPMAMRQRRPELLIVFRTPPRLAVVNTQSGSVTASIATCGDPDDVFVDDGRDRAYVSCGAGFIDVFQLGDSSLSRLAHMPTAAGARTAIYDSRLDRLFLAVKATSGTAPAIWVYKSEQR